MPRPRYRKKIEKAKNGKEYTYYIYRLYDERLPRGELDIKGKTQKELDLKIEKKKKELDKGLTPGKETFGEYIMVFFNTVHGQELAPNTITRYTEIFNIYIKKSFLAKTRLKDINGLKVQGFFNELTQKGVNPKTISLVACIVKPTIKYAFVQGQLQSDFSSSLRLPPIRKGTSKRSSRFIPDDITSKLVKEIKGDHVLDPLVVIALNTGMRRGELLGLRWDDIDVNTCTISVDKQYNHRTKKLEKPKTEGSNRKIFVSPKLIDYLTKHKLEQEKDKRKLGELYDDKNLVVCNNAGNFLSPSTIDRHLKTVSKAIDSDIINMHDFRKTFSTKLMQLGTSDDVVKDIMGHTDINTTKEYYRSVEEYEKKECIDKMIFIG